MKVKDLIKILQSLPQELDVVCSDDLGISDVDGAKIVNLVNAHSLSFGSYREFANIDSAEYYQAVLIED